MGRDGRRSWRFFPLRVLPHCLPSCCLPFSSLVLHNITRGIFETIVEQAPFAIEDLMDEMEEEEEESEGDEEEEDVSSKKLLREPPKGEDDSAFARTCPHLCASPPGSSQQRVS